MHFHYAPVVEVLRYPIPDRLDFGLTGFLLAARLAFAVLAIAVAYRGARRKYGFDVTYLTNKYVAALILLLRGRHEPGVLIYSERNIWPWLHASPPGAWRRFRYRANLLLGKFVCMKSDGVHVNSASLRDAMARHGIQRTMVAPIPNGIEMPLAAAPLPLAAPVRVGFVARLVEDKGVRILVEAVRRLNVEKPQTQFEILGDGPLRRLVQDSGLRDCRVWGEVPRAAVLEALRSIHIALFLSPVENVPSNALLEALALGKAVIATNVGDTPRFLSDQRNALLCEPNADSVANAVRALCGTPKLYERLTAGARELAASYSWEAVSQRHLAFYAATQSRAAR